MKKVFAIVALAGIAVAGWMGNGPTQAQTECAALCVVIGQGPNVCNGAYGIKNKYGTEYNGCSNVFEDSLASCNEYCSAAM